MAERASPLAWTRDGNDWPNREASRFIETGGIVWHIQQFGQGPPALLVHGTGASTHSWAWLMPHLAAHFSILAMDLPGHAFTSSVPARSMSLPGLAAALGELLRECRFPPALAIGHSAGAAILARMALDTRIAPELIVSINGALTPFSGAAGHIFPAMAKALFVNPLTTRFFAWRATQRGAVERLIEGTGSHVPERSLELYRRLFRAPGHVAGALAMMANWDLAALNRDLPQLAPRFLQIVGSNDRAVPPDQAFQLARRMPGARVELVRGVGHVAHEEAPEPVGRLILRAAAGADVAEGLVS